MLPKCDITWVPGVQKWTRGNEGSAGWGGPLFRCLLLSRTRPLPAHFTAAEPWGLLSLQTCMPAAWGPWLAVTLGVGRKAVTASFCQNPRKGPELGAPLRAHHVSSPSFSNRPEV